MEEFNVLSLFDGMSCCQIALNRIGKIPTTYYASEIEKNAIKATQINFPDTIQLGDVRDIDVSKLKPIQLIAGGSPCQSFSFAGKRKGMVTKEFPPFKKPTQEDYEAYLANEETPYREYEDYCEAEEEKYIQNCAAANREVIEILKLETYLELKSQGFEFEGQSYLFWEYVRILQDIRKYNPDVKFLLENVEMGAKWERVLSEAIGIPGVHINSSLVSAQVRKRIYWTNIRTKKAGLFGDIQPDIPLPADKGILLKHILEKQVDEKYYLSEKAIDLLGNTLIDKSSSRDKSMTIDASYFKGVGIRNGNCRQVVKVDKKLNPKKNQDKASCLTAGAHSGGNHSDMDLIIEPDPVCVAMRGRNPENPSDRTTGAPTEQRLEPKTDGKTNCLTSVAKDNLIIQSAHGYNNGGLFEEKSPSLTSHSWEHNNHVIQLNPSKESGGQQPFQQNRVYDIEGKSPALPAPLSTGSHNIVEGLNERQRNNYKSEDEKANSFLSTSWKGSQANGMTLVGNTRIRRLTPIECCRLQNVPDDYFFKDGKYIISETAVYKCLGNGWTIDVIAHFYQYLP